MADLDACLRSLQCPGQPPASAPCWKLDALPNHNSVLLGRCDVLHREITADSCVLLMVYLIDSCNEPATMKEHPPGFRVSPRNYVSQVSEGRGCFLEPKSSMCVVVLQVLDERQQPQAHVRAGERARLCVAAQPAGRLHAVLLLCSRQPPGAHWNPPASLQNMIILNCAVLLLRPRQSPGALWIPPNPCNT